MILLVEDNESDEVLTLRALGESTVSHQVKVARDGGEAVELLLGDDPMPQPAVVLLDLQLPVIGGLEVLERIRADDRTAMLPVVVLTSSDEESDLMSSYAGRANSYVRKPLKSEEFAKAIREVALYWLLAKESPPEEP